MQVQRKILLIWRKHYQRGDLANISQETGMHESVISRIINNGACSEANYDKLSAYFIKKVQEDREKEKIELAKYQEQDQD